MGSVEFGQLQDGKLTICLKNRIDSGNAKEAEKEIKEILAEQTEKITALVMDAEELKYISSAGLRVLLVMRKRYKDFSVINVSSEVYEVLEMTGFTEMMNVQKAFRKISVEGCEIIGSGAYGNVYRLNPDTIVKVYEQGRSAGLDFIRREQETSRKAFIYGLPTAISFDVVKVGDDLGVVYEMLDADTLGSYLTKHPDQIDTYVEKMAELGHLMHETEVKDGEFQTADTVFLSVVPSLKGWTTPEEYQHVLDLIGAIPKGKKLVHGDFHTKNVMVRDGELELIDMGDISQGHPIIDLCSLYKLNGLVTSNPDMAKFMGTSPEIAVQIWPKYKKFYFGDRLNEESEEALKEALDVLSVLRTAPIGVARFANREMPEEQKKAFIDSRVQSLVELDLEKTKEIFERVDELLYR